MQPICGDSGARTVGIGRWDPRARGATAPRSMGESADSRPCAVLQRLTDRCWIWSGASRKPSPSNQGVFDASEVAEAVDLARDRDPTQRRSRMKTRRLFSEYERRRERRLSRSISADGTRVRFARVNPSISSRSGSACPFRRRALRTGERRDSTGLARQRARPGSAPTRRAGRSAGRFQGEGTRSAGSG